MNIFDFFNEWNGKLAKFPGALDGECITLVRAYCNEVLAMPETTMGYENAKDIWLARDWNGAQAFDFITNRPWNVPQKGDIVVWGSKVGTYGHIGIFWQGGVWRFDSIDCNWGPDRHTRLVNHSYYGVLGWLRKK